MGDNGSPPAPAQFRWVPVDPAQDVRDPDTWGLLDQDLHDGIPDLEETLEPVWRSIDTPPRPPMRPPLRRCTCHGCRTKADVHPTMAALHTARRRRGA